MACYRYMYSSYNCLHNDYPWHVKNKVNVFYRQYDLGVKSQVQGQIYVNLDCVDSNENYFHMFDGG